MIRGRLEGKSLRITTVHAAAYLKSHFHGCEETIKIESLWKNKDFCAKAVTLTHGRMGSIPARPTAVLTGMIITKWKSIHLLERNKISASEASDNMLTDVGGLHCVWTKKLNCFDI